MVSRTFAELVKDLRMRRIVGDKPPVLLLGAGASADAGIGAMQELFAFFDCADFEAFCKYIGQTTAAERYRYLSDFLQTRKPDEVSPGYHALATLCAQNYFDLALTARLWDHYGFRVGVNNIFDRRPPIFGSNGTSTVINACPGTFCSGNTFPNVYDALGRYIFAGVTLDF